MTRHIILAVLALAALTARAETADHLFLNAQIDTPAGWQEALAVKDGKILAIGRSQDLLSLRGKETLVEDVKGATMLPGLHDMHVHPLMAGLEMGRCKFSQEASPPEIVAAVAKCAAVRKPGEWILGGQWQASLFHDAPPDREMLDKAAPNNPVLLSDISTHSLWANSKALELAHIDRSTRDPAGGIIDRDGTGAPTGLLRENASTLIRPLIPAPSPEENIAAIRDALHLLLSYGVTSITDAGVRKSAQDAYDALSDRGELIQRVRGCMVYGVTGAGADFDRLIADRNLYARPRYRTDCVKVFMDGVPTESHTAAMLDPYAADLAGHVQAPERGLLLLPPTELDPLVTRMDKLGITVKFHAAGDGSARAAFDAVAAARSANGPGGPPHEVAHLTFVDKADLSRAAALGATLEYSPYFWFPSPINDDIVKAVGAERTRRVWPVREGIDSGALVIAGSDWSVVPSPNPWIGIETLVTRKAPDNVRAEEVYGPDEAITLRQALDLFTINAARELGQADHLGSLEPGKLADFIVLDRNPFRIPVTEIHKIVVKQAFMDGKLVYSNKK